MSPIGAARVSRFSQIGDAIPDSGVYPQMPHETTSVTSYENVIPDPDVNNPVLTASDVTDESADYVADPFMYVPDSNDAFTDWHMFFEIYRGSSSYAVIGHATSADQGVTWTYDQTVIDIGSHLSYPMVFREGDTHYIFVDDPAGSPRLFRNETWPNSWTDLGQQVSNTTHNYKDFNLFLHNNRYWLVVGTDDGATGGGIRVYYSGENEAIESATWTAHPSNPVVSGREKAARGAGRSIVQSDGTLIAYYQDGVDAYGDKVRVYEVGTLNTSTFSDTELTTYSPVLEGTGSGWNSDHMHHYDPWWMDANGYWRAAVDGQSGTEYSIGIYRAIAESAGSTPTTIVSRPDDDDSATAYTDSTGLLINPNADFTEFGARISNNVANATRARLYDYSSASYVQTVDISALVAGDAFTFTYDITQGTDYGIELDANGGEYTIGFASGVTGYPYTSTDIDIVGRSQNGSQDLTGGVANVNDIGNVGL